VSESTKTDVEDGALRAEVSRAYESALERSKKSQGGCCSPTIPAGEAAKLAGYDEELANAPEGAVRSSFGCGNPVAFAELAEGQTVLDLGSGAGLDLILAARRVGPTGRVIGVDMTDAMLEAARENVAEAGLSDVVELRAGIIEELPVEDASVDLVVSNCVINLSPDKPAVFRELARVLKPGGRFSISDIMVEELPDWLRNHAAARAACIGGAISEADYVAGLEAAGLSDVHVAERLVYDADGLRGITGSDFDDLGVGRDELERAVNDLAGKVWSARLTGGVAGQP
jgi:SAM-dependent methyltransferase